MRHDMAQLGLDLVNTPRARTTDPETSHNNGPTNIGAEAALVLQLIARYPGATNVELGRYLTIDQAERLAETLPRRLTVGEVLAMMYDRKVPGYSPLQCTQMTNKRPPDLRNAGYIESALPVKCSVTGARAGTWTVTDKGRKALDRLGN